MRIQAILNTESGALSSLDLTVFQADLQAAFEAAGHTLSIDAVPGRGMGDALERAASSPDVEAFIVAGGDGSVSGAAGFAWRSGKPLGVLPAGTMNLFARALGMPMDLEEAVKRLAAGEVRAADICTANDRPFVHQFAVGMQPRLVQERNTLEYAGRLAKIWASVRAAFRTLRRPPAVRAEIDWESGRAVGRFRFIAIANNPYGEGRLPYADWPDRGVMAIYRAGRINRRANARLVADMLRGAWGESQLIDLNQAKRVTLDFPRRRAQDQASLDGELIPLAARVDLRVHPGALKVLAPSGQGR